MGSHVRNPPNRPKPHLHRHPPRLRHLPSPHRPLRQLRHAPQLPLPNRLHRQPRPRHRRRQHRRHVPPQQTRLRHRNLGDLRGLRTRTGTFTRRLRRAARGVDVDDLGTHVAVRLLPPPLHLLPARNQFLQHPIPAHAAPPQGHGHPILDLPARNRERANDGERHRAHRPHPPHHAQFPRTHRLPPEPLHRTNLRPPIHLVRILPHRLHGDLQVQP